MSYAFESYLEALTERLRTPLPGIVAQREMAPIHRLDDGYDPFPPGAQHAAVLILLWPRNPHGVAMPLIGRPEDGTIHAGQGSLPGGRREPGEDYPVGTAIRETREELGITGAEQRVLGVLTPLHIPVSNTVVIPVVAAVPAEPRLQPSTQEVTAVHVVHLDRLHTSRSLRRFTSAGGSIAAPCYLLDEVVVWGATAMILSEFFWLHRDALGVLGEL